MSFSASAEAFSSSAVTSLAANASMSVAVGDLVYVVAFSESSTSNTHTFTDSLGNPYTQIVNLADPGNARTFSQHYSKITVAGSALITMAIGSSQPARFGAASYTGITGALLDHQETIFTSDPGTGTDAVVVTALTVSSQPAWVFGAAENGYGPSLTAGTGFAGDFAPSSWTADGTVGLFESRRVTSTSPISATFTLGTTGTGHMVGVSAVFAEAAPALLAQVPTPRPRQLLRARSARNYAGGWFGLSVLAEAASWFDPFTVAQKSSGSPVYSRQTDETISFADGQTSQVVFNSSRGESVAFTDGQTSQVVFNSNRAESLAFTDGQTASLVSAGSVGEAVAFADSQSATAAFSATQSESLAFTDSQDASVVPGGTDSVAETISFTDGQTSTGVFNVVVGESLSFADSQTGEVPGTQVVLQQGPLGFTDDTWKDKRKLRRRIREALEAEFAEAPALVTPAAVDPIPDLVAEVIARLPASEPPVSTIGAIVAKVVSERRAAIKHRQTDDDEFFFLME